MDGIDVACIETDGETFARPIASMAVDYDLAMRGRLAEGLEQAKALKHRDQRMGALAALEEAIDQAHIQAVKHFLTLDEMDGMTPDLIGYHGQTVLHRPHDGLTVQLGKGQALANALQIDVVYDMRANDMAHGGQGAPLAPAYHAALGAQLDDQKACVAFVNIGGISNVTFVGGGHDPIAFDCGPGNALIDQWMQREAGLPFDQGGLIALEGAPNKAIIADYLGDSFFEEKPPKSLDRFDFTLDKMPALELSDGAHTLAAITAEAIYKASDYAYAPPKTWVLCGGGRLNQTIVQTLSRLAKNDEARVTQSDALGFDGDMIEAEAWAYLAVRSVKGLALTWPSTTGCDRPVTGGVLVKPSYL